jgi:hypothetical protein
VKGSDGKDCSDFPQIRVLQSFDYGREKHCSPVSFEAGRHVLNRGTQPCVMAFVLVDPKPAEAGGKVLNAVG